MRQLFLLILFLGLSIGVKAQDIIFLKDGNEIFSKIIDISPLEVTFKKYTNIDGPTYKRSISEIKEIKYQNGSTENFEKKKETISKAKHYLRIQPPVNDGIGIAEVQQINGIDVYVLCKPLLEYEIVGYAGDFLSDVQLKNIFSNRGSIRSRTFQLVEEAYNASKSQDELIHGLIYSDGGSVVLIRYINKEKIEEGKKIAKVDLINGKELYILSKPLKPYKLLKTKTMVTGTLTSFVTLGLIKSAIRDDLQRFIESYDFRKLNFSGVLYEDGYEAHTISH